MDRIIRKNTKARVNLACPECGMNLTKTPNGGIVKNGDTYCCQGCADGTGCTCYEGVAVKKSFSRPGDIGWRNSENRTHDNNFNAEVTTSSRRIGEGRDKTKPRFKSRDSSHHDNSSEPRGKRLKSQNKPKDSTRQQARGQSEERGKLAKPVGRRQGSRGGDRVSRTGSKGK
jgi:hypothetical protein